MVLVGKETREATKTLEKLNLTIVSSKQWGDHPSMVYYFGNNIYFYYDKNLFTEKLFESQVNNCLAIRNDDLTLTSEFKEYKKLKNFNSYSIFKR